mmetsp:Transcript_10068/g.29514  ORF Transcript_10068/g.29514 Transcript_10068/m.29514 type:complete len:297 (+) Transcript_10068:2-892(+)
MRARWLESFLGHAHLRVERTGGRKSSGYPLYRGLSDGLRCSWTEYLQTMLRGKVERYEVRYKIGTADAADTAGSAASAAAAAGAGSAGDADEAPWAAASASRAANPYLKQSGPQYKEYSEVVEPRRVAQGLMSICRQLALEWSSDLLSVSSESLYLGDVCGSGGGGDGGEGRVGGQVRGVGEGGAARGGESLRERRGGGDRLLVDLLQRQGAVEHLDGVIRGAQPNVERLHRHARSVLVVQVRLQVRDGVLRRDEHALLLVPAGEDDKGCAGQDLGAGHDGCDRLGLVNDVPHCVG